jgi:hypothetical protein
MELSAVLKSATELIAVAKKTGVLSASGSVNKSATTGQYLACAKAAIDVLTANGLTLADVAQIISIAEQLQGLLGLDTHK